MPANSSITKALTFAEDSSKVLGLVVGGHTVKPGMYIPRAEAQSPPDLSFNVHSNSDTYMVIGIDIDAPFPSLPILGPILHWIQPGLKPEITSNGQSTFKVSAPFVANYIGPAPPPGSTPHRYVFILYKQPADFDGSKFAPSDGKNLSNWYRMRFSLDDWIVKANLADCLAVNYFTSN
ncbi:phosphatidylethanolamine-binding protein [Dipodascopsis uninucleata]